MSEKTAISWCDSTFNPWIGCTKVSPACDHCYAARQDAFRKWTPEGWGGPRRRTSDELWQLPSKWNAVPWFQCKTCGNRFGSTSKSNRRQEFATCRCGSQSVDVVRRRVFCASLADVFDNQVPLEWREDLFALIQATPNLDWLLLTKRIGNAADMMFLARGGHLPLLQNVWLGATICNQEEADRDIPKLLAVPARVRFLSIEPMLGAVDLRLASALPLRARLGLGDEVLFDGTVPGIDWVICGGESGPQARPMRPDWVRSLRDQCDEAGVPFHFKQWGEWKPIGQMQEDEYNRLYMSRVKAKPHEDQGAIDDSYGRRCTVQTGVIHHDATVHRPTEPMAFLQGTGAMQIFQVGTKAAGRLLDGAEHNGFPR